MVRPFLCSWFLLCARGAISVGATLVNFDNLASGTVLTNQCSGQGRGDSTYYL